LAQLGGGQIGPDRRASGQPASVLELVVLVAGLAAGKLADFGALEQKEANR